MEEVEHIAEVSQAERYVATLFLQCREIANFFEAPEADKVQRPVPIPPPTPPPVQPKHNEEDDEFLGGAPRSHELMRVSTRWCGTQKLVQAGFAGSSFRALYIRRCKLDAATASVEEIEDIEVPCPINQFALLIEIRLENQEVLSHVVEMNVDTEEPETLKADLGRVASLLPVSENEAMELSLSATLIRKSDGAFKTVGKEYIDNPSTLLQHLYYLVDLFVSLTDRDDSVASLDTLHIELLDTIMPFPIKNVITCWAELGKSSSDHPFDTATVRMLLCLVALGGAACQQDRLLQAQEQDVQRFMPSVFHVARTISLTQDFKTKYSATLQELLEYICTLPQSQWSLSETDATEAAVKASKMKFSRSHRSSPESPQSCQYGLKDRMLAPLSLEGLSVSGDSECERKCERECEMECEWECERRLEVSSFVGGFSKHPLGMAMWLLRSISGEESGTSAAGALEGAQHFSLSDEVQDDGQELEAEYDFEAFNKKTPAEVSDSAVQESRDAVSQSTAPPAAEGESLRLARCLQALRQLEGGLKEANECAAAAKTADFADFSRLHQVLQQQHELVTCTLREVTPEDSNEQPLEKRMAQLEALATDYPVLEASSGTRTWEPKADEAMSTVAMARQLRPTNCDYQGNQSLCESSTTRRADRSHGSGAGALRRRFQKNDPGQVRDSTLRGRMETTSNQTRTKDGVPIWSGDTATFVAYEEQCLLWEQGIAPHKRGTCAPRLISELQGAARRLVMGKPPEWVSYPGGVRKLMNHLRQALGKPQLAELGEFLSKYFKGTRRRAQETINEYVTRKSEAYMRACQALQRVTPTSKPASSNQQQSSWRQPYWETSQSRRSSVDASEMGSQADQEDDEAETTAASTGRARNSSSGWDNWGSDYSYGGWSSWWGSSWNWDNQYYGNQSWPSQWNQQDWYARTEAVDTAPAILPDFVQGWLLLQDAGLSLAERNLVQTALAGDFAFDKVAQELRNQLPETEIRKHDQHHRASSFIGEDISDGDDGALSDGDRDSWTEEGLAAWDEAEKEAQTALVAAAHAKRTLREARMKQLQVKQSRKYFKVPSSGGRGSTGYVPDDSRMTCLACGKVGHRAAHCPNPPKPAGTQAANSAEEEAPFVCFSTAPEEEHGCNYYSDEIEPQAAWSVATPMTTHDAVKAGYAVIDGGATKTLGSVTALENILAINHRKWGKNQLKEVDRGNRPLFGFGNSTENRCLSTIKLGVQAGNHEGELSVHALGQGTGPVLFSIDTLRRLKAVIDFDNDLAVFRALDENRILKLARSQTGHQLLPLTENWWSSSFTAREKIPGLDAYLPKE
ncbi:unnamed protein product [Symbiodinium sp. CCMP2592]|nr:unnamed protein product [Symbiodinium sp. CCMP2592]